MKKTILIVFLSLSISLLAQKKIDSADCYVDNYDNIIDRFLKDPNCDNYLDIKKLSICKRTTIQDFSIIYIAALKSNCIQAYQDLFSYYKQLNFNLSKKSVCNRDSLLLENLDIDSKKLAINSLLKANIDKSIIATYHYYGIYVKKDRKLAIQLLKESYNYEVSENELVEELSQAKELITPCSY